MTPPPTKGGLLERFERFSKLALNATGEFTILKGDDYNRFQNNYWSLSRMQQAVIYKG